MTGEGMEHASAMAWPRRGGFWRRFLASFIDYLVVLIPLYFLGAGLFPLTDGGVKGHFWLLKVCSSAKVHGGPSLEFWQVCRSSQFSFPIADWAVGTQFANLETVSIDLNSKGNFRPAALDLGFPQLPALAIYLLVMEMALGRSVGKRALVLVVYDENNWQRRGLPLQKAFRRQVIKFLGAFPLVLTGAWSAFQAWGSVPGPAPSYSWLEFVTAFVAFGLALIWPLWIGISIALGHEPIHDRIAGTTVRTRETHE
ncbi:RDD family protein [Mesorhizobium carmichaelinearum]|uniref:RDD family protein n=1 Tax=Mesorhizobium carmichaelinearum TaxID=1208188 RepID=UPI000BA331CB|nr:RDD family protein [Mesorhizobium carmichaelinearum]